MKIEKILGGIETAAGIVGISAVAIVANKIKDTSFAPIIPYLLSGYLVLDGGADLITGKYDSLGSLVKNGAKIVGDLLKESANYVYSRYQLGGRK